MAVVTCQALMQPDSLTLIWSEEFDSFTPYSLEGPELAELRRLAAQADQHLAKLGNGDVSASNGFQLAKVGFDLHRQLFQLNRPGESSGCFGSRGFGRAGCRG